MTEPTAPTRPSPSRPENRWLAALIIALCLTGALVAGYTVQRSLPLLPAVGVGSDDPDAAAAAEKFLRLVADSQRNDDTEPLPCTWVTGPESGGLLNPCMDALAQRWAELEPIEELGPSLRVRGVTTRTGTFAEVTDANILPRPAASISVTLERVGTDAGARNWRVRQLNHLDLPR